MKQLETFSEYTEFISSNSVCVIDFWAEWCGPCKRISSFFESLVELYPNISFAKINVDNIEFEELVQQVVKNGIPLFLGYKNGEKVDENIGANSDRIKELCERLLHN